MDSAPHWSIWLIAGLGTGLLPILGEHRIIGLLQTLLVLASPVIIFMQAGANFLPFLLFYGALTAAASLLFRRKKAQEERQRRKTIDRKKKDWGA